MKASVISLLLAGLVAAQDFTGQPECAIDCLKDAIPKAGCALTDTACQCKVDVQAKLVGLAAPCLISKCSPSDLAKAQSAAAEACKKDTSGSSSSSSSQASSHTTEPSSETSAASTTDSTTDSTTEAGTTTTGPASTAATETTASETASETGSETTNPPSTHATSAGHTIPTSPSGVSNSTSSGVRSVVTRTSTAFVGGGDGGSQTSGVPASTTLAGSDATAPIAGVLGAVLAALMAL